MNARKLQLGKAMSAALFVLLLSVAGTKNALAQTQVATLQHGNEISAYYGANAFSQAHEAAADGDIITLSEGTFYATTITKAITLRGAGVTNDTITVTSPTNIVNDFTLNVPNDSIAFSAEGIYFMGTLTCECLYNPTFIRCNIGVFDLSNGTGGHTAVPKKKMDNGQFINCKVLALALSKQAYGFTYAYDTKIFNSVVGDFYCDSDFNSYYYYSLVTVYNSFIENLHSSAHYLFFYNSIIYSGNSAYRMVGNSVAYNSIGIIADDINPFNCATFNCMTVDDYSEVFQTFDGSEFSFDEQYLLKDEIATGFLGNDGTQVSIYGGSMPYESRPFYMLPTRFNVPNKSSIDGHLNIEVEIVNEEEQ